MVDANKTSRKINYRLGFANIKLGEKSNLSFNPDIKLVNDYSSISSKKALIGILSSVLLPVRSAPARDTKRISG